MKTLKPRHDQLRKARGIAYQKSANCVDCVENEVFSKTYSEIFDKVWIEIDHQILVPILLEVTKL